MKKWILYALVFPCLCKGDIIFTPYNGDLTPEIPYNNVFTIDINDDGISEFEFSAIMDAPLYSVHVRCLDSGKILVSAPLGAISAFGVSEGRRIDSDALGGDARWDAGLGILSHRDLQHPIGVIKGGHFLETNTCLGVSFQINGNTHYGWIQIDNPLDVPGGTLTGFAYESTPGIGIVAGAVPEPSSVFLVFLGAFTLWGLKLRKERRLAKENE